MTLSWMTWDDSAVESTKKRVQGTIKKAEQGPLEIPNKSFHIKTHNFRKWTFLKAFFSGMGVGQKIEAKSH